jgi:hypothetical protein
MQLRLLMLTMQFKRTIIRELKPSPVDTLRQLHSMTPTSTWELPVRRAGEHTKRGNHREDHRLTKEPPSGGVYSGELATPAYAGYAVQENRLPGAQTITGGYAAPDPEYNSTKNR